MGDFVDQYILDLFAGNWDADNSAVSDELADTLRAQFGLDKPFFVQYGKWAWRMVQGDFGMSLEFQKPVSEIVSERLLLTVILAGTTALFAWALSIPIGIYSAVRQHSIEDYTFTFIGFLGLAVPDFLLALWLLWITFTYFPDFSIGGLFSPEYIEAPWSIARIVDLASRRFDERRPAQENGALVTDDDRLVGHGRYIGAACGA